MLRLVVNAEKKESPVSGLYLVTDEADLLPERVRKAIEGGVRAVQFRRKLGDENSRLDLGFEIRSICRSAGIPFIVNDDLDLALELDADGLHLGQEDGDPGEARRRLGKKLLGISTHNLEEALQAQSAGADYIGFGAMYPSGSKAVTQMAGPEGLKAIRDRVSLPVVAIGGITRDNAPAVIDAGADSLAVISAVLSARNPDIAAAELSLLFNRKSPSPRGSVLTVAGSDSGGGAGIQADIKTVALLGSYCAAVVTALTAQNTRGVSGIFEVPGEFLGDQLDAVLSDIPVDVVKTGMLFSAEAVDILCDRLRSFRKTMVVVDPVMTAKGGKRLLESEAVRRVKTALIPLSYLVTPNIPEAEALTGVSISDEEGMQEAARALVGLGARNVLIKGGHLPEGECIDILYDGSGFHRFHSPRLLSMNTHGTGCTMASAIAALLASGEPLPRAVSLAKDFVTAGIRTARKLGKGHGPLNHVEAAKTVSRE